MCKSSLKNEGNNDNNEHKVHVTPEHIYHNMQSQEHTWFFLLTSDEINGRWRYKLEATWSNYD